MARPSGWSLSWVACRLTAVSIGSTTTAGSEDRVPVRSFERSPPYVEVAVGEVGVDMTISGLVLAPDEGQVLHSSTLRVITKISGRRSNAGSLFEIEVPIGFDVGAHVHVRSEEFFYVLGGEVELFAFEPTERTDDNWREWRSVSEERVRRVNSGAVMHVPAGCPHAFANPGPSPARLLFQSSPPPDHERYFEELVGVLESDPAERAELIRTLRQRYDIHQLTPLFPGTANPR